MIQNNNRRDPVPTIKSKVLVALSGGVDSAVSAAFLKKRGLEVGGVFFRFFDGPGVRESLENAEKIAKKLDIPLEIVDARREFKKKIIDYFVSAYKKGITPNPCVVCNREMKFDLLFRLMKKEKADFVATGHYVRIKREFSIFNFQFSNNDAISKFQNVKLLQARDKTKDQSYFLYRLTQKELSKIIFPLGELKKTEVKKMAKKFGLPVVGDGESQDICFLPGKDINSYLRKRLKWESGDIRDEKGNYAGKHHGLPFYTLGQRKGIEIGGTGPYFVIGKIARKNELVVSSDPKKLLTKKFMISQANWMNKEAKFPLRVKVQIRYHSEKFPAIIRAVKGGKFAVETKRLLRAATPGQSAVFYEKNEVLGGGVIC